MTADELPGTPHRDTQDDKDFGLDKEQSDQQHEPAPEGSQPESDGDAKKDE